jgi:predicted nucleotidyltransferase component of viral defense system
MNNLIANFSQILEFAREYGLPEEKKRGIVREYLQSMFLAKLYRQPAARKLTFLGGTSLRLLRNLNRFSGDLDFDILGLSDKQMRQLVDKAAAAIKLENVDLELKSNLKPGKTYFELCFPALLYDLKISTNPREKLVIKVDYSRQWRGQNPERVLLNRYGFLEPVSTLPINQIIVQKMAAYVQRNQTQPRDIYDVVWLFSRGARVDKGFLAKNRLMNLVNRARAKWQKEGVNRTAINKLRPFLFDAAESRKLTLFGGVIKQLGT